MQLADELERRASVEANLFHAQLMREDAARLRKLEALARSAPDVEAYRRGGRRLGWTAQDARTGELGETLDRLLDAVHEAAFGAEGESHVRVSEAWIELTRVRMERLVGCLSTPVPKPTE